MEEREKECLLLLQKKLTLNNEEEPPIYRRVRAHMCGKSRRVHVREGK
jgi:hypothetical protein